MENGSFWPGGLTRVDRDDAGDYFRDVVEYNLPATELRWRHEARTVAIRMP